MRRGDRKKTVTLRFTHWPTWSCPSFQRRVRTLAILFFAFLPWMIAGLFFTARISWGTRVLDGTLLDFAPAWIGDGAAFIGEWLWLFWIFLFLPAHFC